MTSNGRQDGRRVSYPSPIEKGLLLPGHDRSNERRGRALLGLGVIAASLVLATLVVGVGFAGGSITAAQYQYGKVTICHHTHSKKHPTVTITISQNAWPAHQRHGDTMGACAPAAGTKGHGHGHSNKGKGDNTGSTTQTTTTTTSHGNSGDNGNHGSGHGHK
jgi:hypothetical protein